MRLVRLAVDRREVAVDGPDARGELVVPVARTSNGAVHEHVVEVWYVLVRGRRAPRLIWRSRRQHRCRGPRGAHLLASHPARQ